MKRGQDIAVQFPGLYLVHQNLPGKQHEFHSHREHIVFMPLLGEITVSTRDKILKAGAGKLIYLPPNCEHSFKANDVHGERVIALVDSKLWLKVSPEQPSERLSNASQLSKELLFYLLFNPKTRNAKSLVETFILTLAESLSEESRFVEAKHIGGNVTDSRIQKSLGYLRQNLNRTVNMTEAAKAAGLSARSFNRLFLIEVGLTPIQVLSIYRIEKAKEALANGKTVTEAAFMTGYNSLSQFITVFRKLTGQLPSEYARNRFG